MLHRTKIGTRIVVGYACLLGLLLLLVVIGELGVSRQTSTQQQLANEASTAINGQQLQITALQLRRFEKDMMFNLDKPDKVKEYQGKWQKAAKTMQDELDAALRLAEGSEKQAMESIRSQFAAYRDGFAKIATAAIAGEYTSAGDMNTAMAPFKKPIQAMEIAAADHVTQQIKHLQDASRQLSETMQLLHNTTLVTFVVALVVGIAVALVIVASIRKPLHLLETNLRQAAENRDLSRQIDYAGHDEVGTAITSINHFFTGVRELVGAAQQGCSRLTETATSLHTVTTEQNRAIGQQAEATSSTAAAIEQLTVSINHVAGTAADIEQDARRSQVLANDGRSLANQTAGEINHIADSIQQSSEVIASLEKRSAEIGGIVHVIKDIADQTNLLALNAAIEAARAGEQGRGFAVVADEVRKLAEKTTQATNEISQMIRAVQQDTSTAVGTMSEASSMVAQGVNLTRQVAEALDSIDRMAVESAGKIAGIATAIGQQGSASNQIAQNVEKIAQMSEENSAATSQLADLAQNLTRLSDTLGVTIRSYRV